MTRKRGDFSSRKENENDIASAHLDPTQVRTTPIMNYDDWVSMVAPV